MAENGNLHRQNVDIYQDYTWFYLVDGNIYFTVIIDQLVNISMVFVDKMTDP